jgi:hypothetical protein
VGGDALEVLPSGPPLDQSLDQPVEPPLLPSPAKELKYTMLEPPRTHQLVQLLVQVEHEGFIQPVLVKRANDGVPKLFEPGRHWYVWFGHLRAHSVPTAFPR